MSLAKSFSPALKELRLHLCQSSASSSGLRGFIQNSYPKLKEANPDLKVLIREARQIQPKVYARFERGVESSAVLEGLSEAEVGKTVDELIQRGAGASRS